MAFVVVNKLSEVTSYFRDVLKQKDTQLSEAISLNLKKEILLEDQVAAIDRAEKQIQALGRELEVSEERYIAVKQKLSEEETHVHLMERKLAVEKDILLKTKEKLDEFKLGVSSLNVCMNEYADQTNRAERIQMRRKNNPNFLDGNSEDQILIEKNEDISKKESQAIGGLTNDRSKTYFKISKDVKDFPCQESLSIQSTCEEAYDKDLTILLLKKEIESALVCLKQVQAQMISLFEEKEEIRISEKQNKRSMECFTRQLLALQSDICDSEEQFKLKIKELEHKILKLEESTQEAKINLVQMEQVFDLELSDAKVVAMQKTVEVGSLLVKFEEVQETMKEADVIINALVIANETSKYETERLKEMLVKLTNERDFLNDEVQFLQLTNNKKDQLYANLEKQFISDLSDTGSLVLSLEDTITEVKAALEEQIESILHDFHCFKVQTLNSTSLTRSWLEDIWSVIIVKDCAMSVLHLCHMGVLLEAVNGLNAENGLLHYGLCESNSVIIDLKEHNLKATKELEMLGTIKGKLLVDIKDSFDRILRKEDETRQLGSKLSSFEKKILDLQFQEELMLARSNSIGSELSHLMGELDTHNTNALAALSNQIKLLKDQEELANLQVEFLALDFTAKEFESLILASELLQTGLQKVNLEKEQEKLIALLEDQGKELIFLNIETHMKKQLLINTEVEVSLLKDVVSSNINCCIDSFGAVENTQTRMFQLLDRKHISLLEKMFNEICENKEMASSLIHECEYLENFIEQLTSENLALKSELSRKDEVVKGMSFDLSLLQESASNAKDQKDDVEEMVAAYESLEDELVLKSAQLDEAFVQNQMLEAQLHEKLNTISALELDLSKKSESLKLVMDANFELTAQLEDVLHVKSSIEEELKERHNVLERLEEENIQMDNALGQMNTLLEGLKNDLERVTGERDELSSEVHVLKEKIEVTKALAEENEARANEAQQIADTRKMYAEDKEEEVKLLERSVEELESTVNVLEEKVDIVKGEAERQRLLREKLETELLVIKNQMITVTTPGTTLDVGKNNILSGTMELQSRLEEKDRDLQKTQEQIEALEKSIAEKDVEISQCREHILELNLHAEAQASEYKQKFKALEAMAEQVKPDPMPSQGTNSSSSKLEKNATKSRGSGSPFKCIGLGLSQQIKSEKDEELTAGRLRIEELEALIASRQKEIFLLNARLAAAESMTHDVIRDLLGVKLDMNNYASLLDHQQVHRIGQKAQVNSEESLVKEQEQELITKLKQQLNEFVEERQGWLEELSRRQAEMMAAQIASEKLRQREQFVTTENEMLKKENGSHKKKVMELEDEVKKLSGQQNLQQRIHHHAKIKEENNLLKTQNEDLRLKLRKMETILSRLKEEITSYRSSRGRLPFIDFDEERLLNIKVKETEEEKFQLTQKLLRLCTSILKAAGITSTAPDISISSAEEALEVLKERISSLERESQDLKFKYKLCNERARLSEIKQESSLLSSKSNENCTTPERAFQTPFFTALDR